MKSSMTFNTCTDSCNHHCKNNMKIFPLPAKNLLLLYCWSHILLAPPAPWQLVNSSLTV